MKGPNCQYLPQPLANDDAQGEQPRQMVKQGSSESQGGADMKRGGERDGEGAGGGGVSSNAGGGPRHYGGI